MAVLNCVFGYFGLLLCVLNDSLFIRSVLEDVPVSTILGTLSALEALCDYALYKSTFTLHYIYITKSHFSSHCIK